MLLPQFLLLDDSASHTAEFIMLVKRIGIANPVTACNTVPLARTFLSACTPATLPVVVFTRTVGSDDDAAELLEWIVEQPAPLGTIPVLRLPNPLEMSEVIGALKALHLPERVKIDTTTLTVRVELWPHGTGSDVP